MRQTMKILVGLPASGKSTYAEKLVKYGPPSQMWHRINYDDLRWYDHEGKPRDYKFSRQAEEEIKLSAVSAAEWAVKQSYNLVIDNTNLSQSAREFWISKAILWNMAYEIVEFTTSLDECILRNDQRTGWANVPRPAIERMALFNNRVTWPVDQKAVLVDIDGTLANGEHRQHFVSSICKAGCINGRLQDQYSPNLFPCPFCKGTGKAKKDWKSYHSLSSLDTPIKPVIEWVRSLKGVYYVCLVSGRGLESAVTTTDWLLKHEIPYDRIFMRASGDSREDSIIKKEILDRITPHIDVAFVIDDRPRVIRMWRENSIKCYDVGKGVEF